MDAVEASKAGVPWCAVCERVEGPFFHDDDGRLVCEQHKTSRKALGDQPTGGSMQDEQEKETSVETETTVEQTEGTPQPPDGDVGGDAGSDESAESDGGDGEDGGESESE
jgi:hypothetical protein